MKLSELKEKIKEYEKTHPKDLDRAEVWISDHRENGDIGWVISAYYDDVSIIDGVKYADMVPTLWLEADFENNASWEDEA